MGFALRRQPQDEGNRRRRGEDEQWKEEHRARCEDDPQPNHPVTWPGSDASSALACTNRRTSLRAEADAGNICTRGEVARLMSMP